MCNLFLNTYLSKDEGRRFAKTSGRIEGTKKTLLHAYTPPGSELLFYRLIFDHRWVELHPSNKTTHTILSRILFYSRTVCLFIFSTDGFKIRDCNIAMIDLSGHSSISMSLNIERKQEKHCWNFKYGQWSKNKGETKGPHQNYRVLNDSGEVSAAIRSRRRRWRLDVRGTEYLPKRQKVCASISPNRRRLTHT